MVLGGIGWCRVVSCGIGWCHVVLVVLGGVGWFLNDISNFYCKNHVQSPSTHSKLIFLILSEILSIFTFGH